MAISRSKDKHRRSTAGATRKSTVAGGKTVTFVWLNRLLILLGVSAVLGVSIKGYLYLYQIPVEHIIVSGKLEHTQSAALEDMVQPALVGGFLNADLERIQTQLQSLPWVYEASVRRRWPNALELHVVEQLPIARWGKSGFLNHEGVVFQSTDEQKEWQELPLLRGPQGSAVELTAIYQQVNEILTPHKLLVKELEIDDRGELEASLQDGIYLVMGRADVVNRLRRFVAVYSAELVDKRDQIVRVDLRYKNGLAVQYKEDGRVAGI
ncbi:MAG: cell division protein FtsQ [Halioglobus sp.]|jgi:cell division protein FtsQ